MGEWMEVPHGVPNCPPGLACLANIDQILVHQRVTVEAFSDANRKYVLKNNQGQKLFHAFEESDGCERCCYGEKRAFNIVILDRSENEVLHINRPMNALCSCIGDLSMVSVSLPSGATIGTVEEEWSVLCPSFLVKNASGDTILKIEGPLGTTGFFGNVDFQVISGNGSVEVGKISKQWGGLAREWFSHADNFGVSFPMELDIRMKALMIGAVFLIDILFYER